MRNQIGSYALYPVPVTFECWRDIVPNRETISQLASTGMLAPAMWLSDSCRDQHYTARPHISFASAADVLRDQEHNPDIDRQ